MKRYEKKSLRKYIIRGMLLLILGMPILISIPFRFDIDLSKYGVLARVDAKYEYEVRNVRVVGVLERRIIRHGFWGGYFKGRLHIEGFDFLDGLDIENRLGMRPNYTAAFGSGRRREGPRLFILNYPTTHIRHPHVNIHGMIGFSGSLDVFAIKIYEHTGENRLGWCVNSGLFFAAPAQSLNGARDIYRSFFPDL